MTSCERILHPVDFSEFSKCALAFAGSIATRYRSNLLVQHVVEVQHKIEASYAKATCYSEYREHLRTRGEEDLAKFMSDSWAADVEPTRVVSDGLATGAILSFAAAGSIDLIVMGTRGRRGSGRFMLGSVTERVIREAASPVLTVHGRPAEFAEAGRLSATRGGMAFLCSDTSEPPVASFAERLVAAAPGLFARRGVSGATAEGSLEAAGGWRAS